MDILNREVLRAELALDHQLDLALETDLTRDEGEKLRVYLDTASPPKRTIGVGRNLDDVGISLAETMQLHITVASCIAKGINHAQAMALLDNDIDRAEAALDKYLPWWRHLDLVRQRVLANMAFNMGIKTLLTFKTTLGLIQAGHYAEAATAMLQSRWASQVHQRANRLAELMRLGPATVH